MTRRKHVAALAGSVGAVAVVTLAIELFKSFVPVLSLGVLYVFAVLVVALVWGMVYAIPVAVASMLAFNWFHLPPLYTFTVAEGSNWFALATYVVVAVTVSVLADRVRRRAAEAEQREREAALLADVAGELLGGRGLQGELESMSARTAQVLGVSRARIELGRHAPPAGEAPLALEADKRMVGTLYLPEGEAPSLAERGRFLPALASLLAVAVDRERLEREAVDADALRRSDTVKTAVLQAVSHDLRSPLTAIRAAADGLKEAVLVPAFLLLLPMEIGPESPSARDLQVAMPLLEAVEQAALREGVPVDARIERGRTPTHTLRRLWDVEHFDRIVVPAGSRSGFTAKDLAWILTNAPSETMILKPEPVAQPT
jgi:two-component system sensor histidine kinase KdpD